MSSKRSPIVNAIEKESYEYLSAHYPDLLTAIEIEVPDGTNPDAVYRLMMQHIGPDRHPLALRARQAANHIARMQRN